MGFGINWQKLRGSMSFAPNPHTSKCPKNVLCFLTFFRQKNSFCGPIFGINWQKLRVGRGFLATQKPQYSNFFLFWTFSSGKNTALGKIGFWKKLNAEKWVFCPTLPKCPKKMFFYFLTFYRSKNIQFPIWLIKKICGSSDFAPEPIKIQKNFWCF